MNPMVFYKRLNEDNRYWVDERVAIMLEDVEEPSPEQYEAALFSAIQQYKELYLKR